MSRMSDLAIMEAARLGFEDELTPELLRRINRKLKRTRDLNTTKRKKKYKGEQLLLF